ncbi:MAG: DotA/TraY family protein [Pseudomonadota bacterium]
MDITKKQILKTAFLPGILPRAASLFGSGFGYLAYLIAVVYNTVRILPNNHEYLKSENIGTYSVRQSIAAAANHLEISWKNIDQIIMFFCVIAAIIIMVLQFILFIAYALFPVANAQTMPATIEGFFVTPNPERDIAYRLLDLVFGIPDFFGSQEATNTPFHQALHGLLEFYSIGIFIVGAMILIYLVIAVVAETAQSGIPFGQRFNKSWAVPRTILFFGLIIPISYGMNAGQYITLGAAKLGSGLASTGWVLFNETINDASETLLGQTDEIVAQPEATDLSHLPGFMMVTKACQIAYNSAFNEDEFDPNTWDNVPGNELGVEAWAIVQTNAADTGAGDYVAVPFIGSTFQDLTATSGGTDIQVVFGVQDEENFRTFNASVAPICGQLNFKVTDVSEPGSAVIHTGYYTLIQDMWDGMMQIEEFAQNYVDINMPNNDIDYADTPTQEYITDWSNFLVEYMEGPDGNGGLIRRAVEQQIANGDWTMPQSLRDYGWAGAGIWYNKIAQQNGALVTAIQHVPMQYLYPQVMERIADDRGESDRTPNIMDRFTPRFSAGAVEMNQELPIEENISVALNQVYRFWNNPDSFTERQLERTDNVIVDVINVVLGSEGLFEICKNTDIHPLAQLSMLGKGMLDRSIQSFAASGVLALGSILPTQFAATFSAASSFFSIFAGVGLLIGFVLFYVLPFLPFLYFFFAVGNWIKGIFEAVVAMPLWALAHLRIDGEGIPGDAAIGGYFLIFEVFIRPILIIFGLLAAVTIFAGMVRVLNEIFYVVISNLSGHDPRANDLCFQNPNIPAEVSEFQRAELNDAFRGPVDQFFFTILYTIIVYMIGTSCFKLIDLIPNQILRWINAEVPAFNDQNGDAAEGLMKYVTIGGSQFGSQIGGSISEIGGGIRQSVQQFMQPR